MQASAIDIPKTNITAFLWLPISLRIEKTSRPVEVRKEIVECKEIAKATNTNAIRKLFIDLGDNWTIENKKAEI